MLEEHITEYIETLTEEYNRVCEGRGDKDKAVKATWAILNDLHIGEISEVIHIGDIKNLENSISREIALSNDYYVTNMEYVESAMRYEVACYTGTTLDNCGSRDTSDFFRSVNFLGYTKDTVYIC